MDSRLLPASYMSANPGDMFVIRNPGNVFPHSRLFGQDQVTGEKAALEVALSNGVKHIAVCGHSDCKVFSCWLLVIPQNNLIHKIFWLLFMFFCWCWIFYITINCGSVNPLPRSPH